MGMCIRKYVYMYICKSVYTYMYEKISPSREHLTFHPVPYTSLHCECRDSYTSMTYSV